MHIILFSTKLLYKNSGDYIFQQGDHVYFQILCSFCGDLKIKLVDINYRGVPYSFCGQKQIIFNGIPKHGNIEFGPLRTDVSGQSFLLRPPTRNRHQTPLPIQLSLTKTIPMSNWQPTHVYVFIYGKKKPLSMVN